MNLSGLVSPRTVNQISLVKTITCMPKEQELKWQPEAKKWLIECGYYLMMNS